MSGAVCWGQHWPLPLSTLAALHLPCLDRVGLLHTNRFFFVSRMPIAVAAESVLRSGLFALKAAGATATKPAGLYCASWRPSALFFFRYAGSATPRFEGFLERTSGDFPRIDVNLVLGPRRKMPCGALTSVCAPPSFSVFFILFYTLALYAPCSPLPGEDLGIRSEGQIFGESLCFALVLKLDRPSWSRGGKGAGTGAALALPVEALPHWQSCRRMLRISSKKAPAIFWKHKAGQREQEERTLLMFSLSPCLTSSGSFLSSVSHGVHSWSTPKIPPNLCIGASGRSRKEMKHHHNTQRLRVLVSSGDLAI